jgi:hypothetical protein
MGPRRIDRASIVRHRGDIRSLDIGSAGFDELRSAIDQIMARCLAAECEIIPLVLQSHTKAYLDNWSELAKFYRYLADRYGRWIQFQTYTDFVNRLPEFSIVRSEAHGA